MTVSDSADRLPPGRPGDGGVPVTAARGADYASQWQLMWWRFKRHRLAVISVLVVLGIYLVAIFAEFLAPLPPNQTSTRHTYAPPQAVGFLVPGENGGTRFQPHVTGYKVEIDPIAIRRTFVPDDTRIIPIGFFVTSDPYLLLGFIPLETKFIGPVNKGDPFYLLGADRLGRDMLSRIVHGARVSMSIGLVGVFVSLFVGVLLGGISGYYGGLVDDAIQRTIEFLKAIPTIPLWMGLAAAIPQNWSPLMVYFLITVLISLIGWTSLAREVRGRFLSMKTEDFVAAAKLDGAGEVRIILRHMAPSFLSHIIATLTLAIPTMILAETALSFLGIGLRPPVVSWGVLLQEAQNVRAVATAPWLLLPGLSVVVAVLSLNFLGDGMRDAADPYAD
ncbi:ABC transporter permease [Pelagibius litoralis]|uniref:ABC transporter permease n=1 Tax=Pelagibius litoralis TaxID=374515 RepID=A0A967F207_9PROT|nr:ABC transporter permease [Pelagibius litoralis]NIA71470.1 ABC transporter permease [Pelagibius litoralis]